MLLAPGSGTERSPASRIAWAASGRNGGFCAASLTHGIPNGISRFGDEMPALLRMGRETLDAIEATLDRLGIDADAERTGELDLAITDWQFEALAETFEAGTAIGAHLDLLDEDAARDEFRQMPVSALEAGDAEHGASVHLVVPELDAGAVLAQARVPVLPGDDARSLAERRGYWRAVVAIAAKNARMCWAVLQRGESFKMPA